MQESSIYVSGCTCIINTYYPKLLVVERGQVHEARKTSTISQRGCMMDSIRVQVNSSIHLPQDHPLIAHVSRVVLGWVAHAIKVICSDYPFTLPPLVRQQSLTFSSILFNCMVVCILYILYVTIFGAIILIAS